MQHLSSGHGSRTPGVARLRPSAPFRRGAKWTLIALLLLSSLKVAILLHASSKTVTTTLIVQVAEAGQLDVQNDVAVVRLRLNPGVAVTLWGDKSCATAPSDAYIITSSGSYTIPLNQIKQGPMAEADAQDFICMQSSDGVLRRSMLSTGGASLKGTTHSAGSGAVKPTWSGSVSIPAARASGTKTSR